MDIAGLAETLTRALGTFEPERYSATDCARLAAWRVVVPPWCATQRVGSENPAAGRAPPDG